MTWLKKTMKLSKSKTKTAAIVTALEDYIRRKSPRIFA
jgi:hypothetical protein